MSASALILEAPFAALGATTFRRTPKRPMDEAKFEAFYRKTAGRIWSYIYRMTGDSATADDLMQKTFFRFLRSNPAIANDDHLPTTSSRRPPTWSSIISAKRSRLASASSSRRARQICAPIAVSCGTT